MYFSEGTFEQAVSELLEAIGYTALRLGFGA